MSSKRRVQLEEDDLSEQPPASHTGTSHQSNRAVAGALGGEREPSIPYQSEMQLAFGEDFGGVEVETGNREALSALGASAATVGERISFADRRPSREVVAHELTHVVQNRDGATPAPTVSSPDSPAEREASAIAQQVLAGRTVDVQRSSDAHLQRSIFDELARASAQIAHVMNQATVYSILNRGLSITPRPENGIYDLDNLLHNSAEWIKNNNCAFIVLSPIHDSTTRNPPDIGYFDPLVQYPAGGGTYPADPTVVNDPHIEYNDPGTLGGMSPGGTTLTIINPASQSDAQLQDTIIHEVQHDADQTWPGQRWADPAGSAFNDYQSEFRAYWLGSGEGSSNDAFGSSADPAVNTRQVSFTDPASGTTSTVATAFDNLRQENIFWQLVDTGYTYVAQNYVQVPAFKAMADAMVSPVGGNLVNSVRIQTLSERLDGCSQDMEPNDPAVVSMFAAADALDDLDRQYLQDEDISIAFWDQARARLSATVYRMLHNTVWFGTRQPWGDFDVPEGDTSYA